LRDFHVARHITFISNQQVYLAALKLGGDQVRVRSSERYSHARPRDLVGTLGQPHAQHDREMVARRDREGSVRGQGIESRRTLDDGFEVLERDMQRRPQLQGARGRNHPASGRRRHQQRVMKEIAKAGELGGERRLAEIQPRRRSGHVRFVDKRIERDEEIEVGPFEIDHVYTSDTKDRFLLYHDIGQFELSFDDKRPANAIEEAVWPMEVLQSSQRPKVGWPQHFRGAAT